MTQVQAPRKGLMVAILLLGSFLTTLAETLLNNALPAIMTELHTTQSTTQWLSTGYFLVAGIVMPTAAYFTNRFNLRPLFTGIMATFLLGLIISATAPTFTLLLVGRLIQALSVGISMPLIQNVLTLIFPANQRGLILGVAGVVISLGPAMGPTLSGIIVDHFSWRMLFLFLIPLTIIALVLGLLFVKNLTSTHADHLDLSSVLLSTLGFGTLLYSCSTLGTAASQGLAWTLLVIGLVTITVFVHRQLRLAHPLLQLRVFLAPSFRKATGLAIISAIALMGPELIVPLYNQRVRGLDATTSGLTLLAGALLMAVFSLVSGRLFDEFGIKKLAYFGFGLATLATLPLLWFDANTPVWLIATTYAVRISGLTFVYMPTSVLALNALPQNYVVFGSTIIVTLQQLATSLGTALLVAITEWGEKASLRHGATTPIAVAQGYHWAFVVILGITAICLFWSLTLKNRTTAEIQEPASTTTAD